MAEHTQMLHCLLSTNENREWTKGTIIVLLSACNGHFHIHTHSPLCRLGVRMQKNNKKQVQIPSERCTKSKQASNKNLQWSRPLTAICKAMVFSLSGLSLRLRFFILTLFVSLSCWSWCRDTKKRVWINQSKKILENKHHITKEPTILLFIIMCMPHALAFNGHCWGDGLLGIGYGPRGNGRWIE